MEIYPNIETEENFNHFEARTILRKEKDGIWYDWKHIQTLYRGDDNPIDLTDKLEAIIRMHKEVYNTLHLGIVDLSLVNSQGEPFFNESKNQQSESKRLSSLILGRK